MPAEPIMGDDERATGLALAPLPPVDPLPVEEVRLPTRRARHLNIDPIVVVDSVLARAEQIITNTDRQEWEDMRLQRYAKYRGWRDDEHPKSFPWPHCADTQPGVLQAAGLRVQAGLNNVTHSLRPLFQAQAAQRANIPKEEHITEITHHQLFVEPGEERAQRALSDYLAFFLEQGNTVAYTPWVRDRRTITSLRVVRKPTPLTEATLTALVLGLVPRATTTVQTGAHLFAVRARTLTGELAEADVEVYQARDDAGTLECFVTAEQLLFDAPIMQVIPPNDVLEPTRITNLQPPSESNPGGAPYVFLRTRFRIDDLRRLKESGTFNYLTDVGLAAIEARVRGSEGSSAAGLASESQLEAQKDQFEGREHHQPVITEAGDIGHLDTAAYLCFDRWDVDGNGLFEEVFWVVERDSKELLEARLLTEKWPIAEGDAPYRPLAEATCIPVAGRWRGIGLLELGEALYDLIKGLLDQTIDFGTASHMPFGFYSASANMANDIVRLAPFEMYPVPGNPRETVYFPQMPSADQTFGLNMLTLALRLFQDQLAVGSMQQGQIPAGRSSALRTTGTTMALLQQGDVRMDWLLLQYFSGLKQVVRNFHRQNRFFFPDQKEIRRVGWDGPRDQAYRTIRAEEIDADADFDFRPDFLLSNPAVLTSMLERVLSYVVTPIAFQAGITDPELFYAVIRDAIKAMRLDPKKYIKPPQGQGGPAILADEAITMLMQGRMPVGRPLEGAEAHLKALTDFMASDAFGALKVSAEGQAEAAPERVEMFRVWAEQIWRRGQQDQMAQMALAFQQALQQPGPSAGAGVQPQPEPELAAAQPNQAMRGEATA